MPEAQKIAKAYLEPIRWTEAGEVEVGSDPEKFYVQFNPQSLKVAYANQKEGEGQSGTSAIQFVGSGTTKLSVELLFDTTLLLSEKTGSKKDVRELTSRVLAYINPKKEGQGESATYTPPGLRFGWNTFTFEGVVNSINETLDFFGEDGTPLRSTVTLEISKQEIKVEVLGEGAGTTPQHQVKDGETLQQAAAGAGNQDDWKGMAAANGIENPRLPEVGALLDVNAGIGLSASADFGASAGFGASAEFGISGGVAGGIGSGLSIGAANNLNPGVASSLGFGASAHTGLTGGIAGGAFGGSAGGSAGGAFGVSAGASASVGASASASTSTSFGASTSGSTLIR